MAGIVERISELRTRLALRQGAGAETPSVVGRVRELQREQKLQQAAAKAEQKRQELLEKELEKRLGRQIQEATSPYLAVFEKFGIFSTLDKLVRNIPLFQWSKDVYKRNPKIRKDLARPNLFAYVEIREGDKVISSLSPWIDRSGVPVLGFLKGEKAPDLERGETKMSLTGIECGLTWQDDDHPDYHRADTDRHWNEMLLRLNRGEDGQFQLDVSGDVIAEKEFSLKRITDSIAEAYVNRSSREDLSNWTPGPY